MAWTIPKIWQNSTAIVLGGGVSVGAVDLTLLEGHRVLAVNNAFELGPWDAMFFGDSKWHRWDHNREGLKNFTGLKVTSNVELDGVGGVKSVLRGRKGGVSDDPTRMMWGVSSGLAAISLAYQFGSLRILLLGFDMRRIDGKDNYHDFHERTIKESLYRRRFIPQFKHVAPQLKERGVEVINCTPESALDMFPIRPLEEVL